VTGVHAVQSLRHVRVVAAVRAREPARVVGICHGQRPYDDQDVPATYFPPGPGRSEVLSAQLPDRATADALSPCWQWRYHDRDRGHHREQARGDHSRSESLVTMPTIRL
jgi:hypothetical protein